MPVKKDLRPDGWLTVKEYAATQIGYNGRTLKTVSVYTRIAKFRDGTAKKDLGFDFKIVGSNTWILPN
jgi:hypothetical protein